MNKKDEPDQPKTNKSDSVRKAALKQLRETRAIIENDHPQLFKTLQILVRRNDQQSVKPLPKQEAPLIKTTNNNEVETIPIDRHKNLEAILKFAASKPGDNKELKNTIKQFLN